MIGDLTARERIFELTAAVISVLVVTAAVLITVIGQLNTGKVPDVPSWLQVSMGTILGYYLTRNGGNKSVAPHSHEGIPMTTET